MSGDLFILDIAEPASDEEHNRARAYVARHAPDLLVMLDLEEERP